MKYRIERDLGDDSWRWKYKWVKRVSFEGRGLSDYYIEPERTFKGGHYQYVYIDDEPALLVPAGGLREHSDEMIFNDYLLLGDLNSGVRIVRLTDFEVEDIEVDGYFGYFVADRNILYILCMHSVMAFDKNMDLLWKTPDISTDGVVLKYIEGDTMTVECNYDPMEKWFDRKISLSDGSIIS